MTNEINKERVFSLTPIYSAVACPHCNCCATQEYYKTNEQFIVCFRCGYHYEKMITAWKGNTPSFTKKEYKGYGICRLEKWNGEKRTKVFHRPLSNEEIIKQASQFLNESINDDKSYFVLFRNHQFSVLAGNPPKDFFLPFSQFNQEKGVSDETLDTIIPL